MCTRFFGHLSAGLFASALIFVVLVSAAPAAFMDLGTSGWEYDAPAGVTIGPPSTSGSTTSFTLQKFNWTTESVTITFRTKADVTQIQHFFMMSMDVTNDVDWMGFKVQLIDKYDAVGPPGGTSSDEAQHPIWAHIHPSHITGGGPDYSPFSPTPSGSKGVDQMTLSGALLPAGSTWLPSRFRLHDMSTQAYANDGEGIPGAMEFKLILTPIPTPEPSSLVLMLSGAAILATTLGTVDKREFRAPLTLVAVPSLAAQLKPQRVLSLLHLRLQF